MWQFTTLERVNLKSVLLTEPCYSRPIFIEKAENSDRFPVNLPPFLSLLLFLSLASSPCLLCSDL